MRVIIASIALALLSTANAATAQSFDTAETATISYADLNLANPAGVAALEGRLKLASNRLCHDLKVTPMQDTVAVSQCRAAILDSAKRQLDLAAISSPSGTVLASR
ncbi:MAG TPA: UrcA family protein [Sphingomicrobium sp.]|jgi:UrcA family protein|nr:UrcA family protein [Sphingomicrobium sp.]